MQLSFSVTNQSLTRLGSFRPVEETVNYLTCLFTFNTTDWDNTTKTAVFELTTDLGVVGTSYIVLLTNNSCVVPTEVLQTGTLNISVFGVNTNYRITTDICSVSIADSLYTTGQTPADPTTTIYDQLVTAIAGKGDNLTYSGNKLSLLSGTNVLSSVTIAGGSGGGSVVTESTVNGNILVDGSEMVVYTLPLDVATVGQIPTKISQLTNDSGYITSAPVQSVNGKTGIVELTASDVGALSSATSYVSSVNGQSGAVTIGNATNASSGLMSSADKIKVDGVESGSQANVIESVSQNGTALTITNKNVNVTVPTKTSEITNDSNYVQDSNYIHTDNNFTNEDLTKLNGISTGAQVNVIESVQQNGTALAITNKTVNVTVPTKTSELTNDSGYLTTAPVTSVNSQTGAVVLTTDNVLATTTNRYVPSVPTTNSSSSYLNGDGVFVPVAVGGASSVSNMFFSNTASSVSGYKTMSYTADTTATVMSVAVTSTADVLSYTYLYPSALDTTVIDAGIWKSTFNAYVSNTQGITRLKIVCFVYHTDGTTTDLFTKYTNDLNATTATTFYTETNRSQFTVLSTDRIGFRVYGNTDRTSSTTIYYTIGGDNPSYINTPLTMRHSQLRDLNGLADYQHMTAAQVTKLNGIETGAQVNTVTSVNGSTGAVQTTTANTTQSFETVTDTGVVSKTLSANTLCNFTGAVTTLTITLPTTYSVADEFNFVFTTDSTGGNLALPATVSWLGGTTPTLSASTYYECSIVNNKAVIAP